MSREFRRVERQRKINVSCAIVRHYISNLTSGRRKVMATLKEGPIERAFPPPLQKKGEGKDTNHRALGYDRCRCVGRGRDRYVAGFAATALKFVSHPLSHSSPLSPRSTVGGHPGHLFISTRFVCRALPPLLPTFGLEWVAGSEQGSEKREREERRTREGRRGAPRGPRGV